MTEHRKSIRNLFSEGRTPISKVTPEQKRANSVAEGKKEGPEAIMLSQTMSIPHAPR